MGRPKQPTRASVFGVMSLVQIDGDLCIEATDRDGRQVYIDFHSTINHPDGSQLRYSNNQQARRMRVLAATLNSQADKLDP